MRAKVLRTLAMAAAHACGTKVDLLDSDIAIARYSRQQLRLGPRRHPARDQPEHKSQHRGEGRLRDRSHRGPTAHASPQLESNPALGGLQIPTGAGRFAREMQMTVDFDRSFSPDHSNAQ